MNIGSKKKTKNLAETKPPWRKMVGEVKNNSWS